MSRGPKPITVNLSEEMKEALVKVVRRLSTAQQLARRANLILLANEGRNNAEIGRTLGIATDAVRKWRGRWVEVEMLPWKK
jgi:DNA-directed RNA polymerase specialized sigma24 family protein